MCADFNVMIVTNSLVAANCVVTKDISLLLRFAGALLNLQNWGVYSTYCIPR